MRPRAPLALLAAALLGAGPAAAQELGRLFFTPEQRAALDARRTARVPDKPAAAPAIESPRTRVDGTVQRSGGRSTVWLNGEPMPESAARTEGARIAPRAPSRVSVPAGEDSRRVDLRVGETLDRGTGEVSDVVGAGEIRVRTERGGKAR